MPPTINLLFKPLKLNYLMCMRRYLLLIFQILLNEVKSDTGQ